MKQDEFWKKKYRIFWQSWEKLSQRADWILKNWLVQNPDGVDLVAEKYQ